MNGEGENQPAAVHAVHAAPAAPYLRPVAGVPDEHNLLPVIDLGVSMSMCSIGCNDEDQHVVPPSRQLGQSVEVSGSRLDHAIQDVIKMTNADQTDPEYDGNCHELKLVLIILARNLSSTGEPMMGISEYCRYFKRAISAMIGLCSTSMDTSQDFTSIIDEIIRVIRLKKKSKLPESVSFMNLLVHMINENPSNDEVIDYVCNTLLFWKLPASKYMRTLHKASRLVALIRGDQFIDDYLNLISVLQNLLMMMANRHNMSLSMFVLFLHKAIQIVQTILQSRPFGEDGNHISIWKRLFRIVFSNRIAHWRENLKDCVLQIVKKYHDLQNQTGRENAVLEILAKSKSIIDENDLDEWTHHELQALICRNMIETHPDDRRRAALHLLMEHGLLSMQYALLMNQRYPAFW